MADTIRRIAAERRARGDAGLSAAQVQRIEAERQSEDDERDRELQGGRFPKGWDEERVKRLLGELDARTDEEWVAADEAAATEGGAQTVITVPASLLPEIRRLLAGHKAG